MIDVITLLAVVALGSYWEWRFRQLGKPVASAEPTPVVQPKPKRDEGVFPCYYCGHLYPIGQRERIGNYNYCSEHGSKRKSTFLAQYTKETPPHDRTIGIHPANGGSQQPDHSEFPWLS